MVERFKQKRVTLQELESSGRVKVKNLMSLLDQHPYRDQVGKFFDTAANSEDYILIDHIDVVYNRIRLINSEFERFNILAYNKHISISQTSIPVDDLKDPFPLKFSFSDYLEYGEMKKDLDCYAIYDAKNTFFDEYDMAKFANRLYKDDLGELADHNIKYFRNLAEKDPRYSLYRSYRMVLNNDELFLRGITSVNRYFEYGVDFAFVVAMLILHKDMKSNEGNQYTISSAIVSESKLELIVAEKHLKDAGEFGQASSAMTITTNDLGKGSLNFTKIIKIGQYNYTGVYLYPDSESSKDDKISISHSTGPERAISRFDEASILLNNTDEFLENLKDVSKIKNPEELRTRIYQKLSNPKSTFNDIQDLKDIFKTAISNEITSFAKLLDMCGKAEELDIDYDMKDKLRYLISDIILSGKK